MRLRAFFIFCFMAYVDGAINELEEPRVDLMPPLMIIDPYKECLQEVGGLYCSGYVPYVVDEPFQLFTMMQKYSEQTATHFNRTKSFYGICVTQKCKEFYIEETTRDLRGVLEACFNYTVWEKYNLKVRVENDFNCHRHGERIEIAADDILVGVVVVFLILLNAVGSLFDIYATGKHNWPVAKYLLCFSIPRNWSKLNAPATSTDSKLVGFQGLYGLRAILLISIISAHCIIPARFSHNPEFFEAQYSTNFMYIFINGPLFMQCFLFMSGFLLVYYLQFYAENNKITWRILSTAILKRWLRMTPSYAVVLAVVATWIRRTGDGPIWHEMVTSESVDCKRNWWWHLIYLNNYVENSRCLPNSWYIATDTQLYCMGVILFIICHKSKYRNIILSSMFVIGMIIPALHTYFQDLDGVLIVSPSTITESFLTNRTFIDSYTRGHTNIPGYIIGMATGYLVYHLQKTNFDISKYRKWRYLIPFYAQIVSIFAIVISCKVLYEGPRPHVVYQVMMAAFFRPLIALFVAATTVGVVFKLEKFYRSVFEWQAWTVLGRLSYAGVLLHVVFIRIISGRSAEPLIISYTQLVKYTILILTVTFLSACVFWMTVETPLAQVVKLTTAGSKDQLKGTKDNNSNDNCTEQNGEGKIKKLN